MKTITQLLLIGVAVASMASIAVGQTVAIDGDDFSICVPDSIVLTADTANTNPICNYTYAWSENGNGSFSGLTTNLSSVTFIPNGNNQQIDFSLTATSVVNGCPVLTDSIVVDIDPLPSISVNQQPDDICQGNELPINFVTVNNTSDLSWSYDGSNGSAFSPTDNEVTSFSPDQGESGTFNLTLDAGGTGACTDSTATESFELEIDPLPSISINQQPDDICQGNELPINFVTVNNTSDLSWSYDGSNGSAFSPTDNEVTSFSPDQGESGTFNLTLDAGGTGACTDSTATESFELEIDPLPSISINQQPDDICQGNELPINFVTVNNTSDLSWSYDGSNGSAFSPADNEVTSFSPDQGESGTYNLTLDAGGTGACTDSTATESFELDIDPLPSISINQQPDDICQGNELPINFVTVNNTSDLSWSYDGSNGSAFSPTDNEVTSFSPAQDESGLFNLTLNADGTGACIDSSATESFELNIIPGPTVNAGTYQYQTVCNQLPISLEGQSSNTNNGVSWSTVQNVGVFSNQSQLVTSYIPPSNYVGTIDMILTGTGDIGCADVTNQVTFNLIPPPNAQLASLPNNYCEGDTNFLQVDASPFNNAYSYLWNVDQIIGANNQSSVQFDPGAASQGSSVEITLTEFINDNTCQTSNTINVSLLFTPEICDYFELAGNILGVNVCETDDSEYFYQWGCGTTDFEGENENFLLYADYEDDCNGDYYAGVSLYEDGSCTVYAGADPTVSVSEEDMTQYLQLYPNPTSDILQLSWDFYTSESLALLIYDISGRLVFQSKLQAGERYRKISVGHLGAGNYRLALQSAERLVQQSFVITN